MQDTGAQSVDRALKILWQVNEAGKAGVKLSELAALSQLNMATTRRLLLALMRADFVTQDDRSRRYYLSSKSKQLGSQYNQNDDQLLAASLPSLHRLAANSHDVSFLTIRRGALSECLHREEGDFPIRTHVLQKGARHPLGCGAGSLAILAAMPDAEIASVLEQNRSLLLQSYPLLTEIALWQGVEQTRQQGFALNPGLVVPNSWGIGVAIRRPSDPTQILGALSIAAIDSRLQPARQQSLGAMLQAEALAIGNALAATHHLADHSDDIAVTTAAEKEIENYE